MSMSGRDTPESVERWRSEFMAAARRHGARRHGWAWRIAAVTLSVLALGGAGVATAELVDSGTPTLAEIEADAEEQYLQLLQEEREEGLCEQAIADGKDNYQCRQILRDLQALEEGSYEPRFQRPPPSR